MASTVTIPLVTLTVGSHDFGPANVPDADSAIVLTIDRTVTNGGVQGFNGQPGTTQAVLTTFQSADGVTWQPLASATVTGGSIVSSKTGQVIGTNTLTTELNPGTGRQVKANVTLTGAPVAVAGSVATQ